MRALFLEIRQNRLLWPLAVLPVLLMAAIFHPTAHTSLFVLSVLAIIPLSVLLSRATECVAAKTGDVIGGLFNATFGNFAELIIALTALAAGQYLLVKATIAGAIITKTLFVFGVSLLSGGLKHHIQEFNPAGARLQAALLFLATIALLFPSTLAQAGSFEATPAVIQTISLALAVLLIANYAMVMLFSLKTHREFFCEAIVLEHHGDVPWPVGTAIAILAGTTVLITLVSHVFVDSVQHAALALGITPAFVGLVIVSIVSGTAETASAIVAARQNRVDLAIGIALGGAVQMALFVAPALVLLSYLVGPHPMSLEFWPAAVVMMLIATATVSLVTGGGRTAWFVGALLITVYLVFALSLYLLPAPVR